MGAAPSTMCSLGRPLFMGGERPADGQHLSKGDGKQMSSTASMSQVQESKKTAISKRQRESRMEPVFWIPADAKSVLDVGCNTGALLEQLHSIYPSVQLAGIDINLSAVQTARALLPDVEIHQGFGY